MYIDIFLATHAIFTTKELREYLCEVQGSSNKQAEEQSIRLIMYHQERGHIFQIRRGLYYTIPKVSPSSEYPADPYLVAGKLAEDAVLAFNSALGIYGIAHSIRNFFYYVTQDISKRRFVFQGWTYQPVPPSPKLRKVHKTDFGITTFNREGVSLRITTLERTLVDILHRPKLAGEIEELWLSLEGISYLNLEEVVDYTLLLSQSSVASEGWFFFGRKQTKIPRFRKTS